MVKENAPNDLAATAESGQLAIIAKPGGQHTGVGRYVHMLEEHLNSAATSVQRVPPSLPPLVGLAHSVLKHANLDVASFLTNYPVWVRYPDARVYHFASQNLASLLLVRPPGGATIVTVHDIIPYMLRGDAKLSAYQGTADRYFDHLAMKGLTRADRLVADSEFTKQSVIKHLEIPAEKIDVIYLGIDHSRFRPLNPDPEIVTRYGLSPDGMYLIYVGSEDPRKNLKTLLRSLALIRRDHHDVHLIKVGRAHFDAERTALTDLSLELGIRSSVHFLDDVPEEDLPRLYNLASVCVMPSLYEGFGFPVLEAMACGTPVVCSNAASLPELAGDAAIVFEPGPDAERSLAAAVENILDAPDLARSMLAAGIEQAAKFTWDRTSNQMMDVYRRVGLTSSAENLGRTSRTNHEQASRQRVI